MGKILTIKEAIQVSKELRARKKIVLAGGCFDILHIGHVVFLEEAKGAGDVLFVLLESDEAVAQRKGKNRPINLQEDRAKVLASLRMVDYVIVIPYFATDREYDELVARLRPAIIATTKGDRQRLHKQRQAAKIHAVVVDVTRRVKNVSSTRLAELLSETM